ncbi:MAG: alpha-D-ribose 1-methylphosphonate 5-triphosphate diphosphatase [Rhodospirillales bacterium 20-64-7]|nr:MAG: alpha-D-ribose 1-methylphosphonate 5-triphosphate diphosphatase [Rhodospirillales bacterium 20-64-7]
MRQPPPAGLARWPSRSAMLSHDAQCVAAGITTVFDALCIGDIGFEKARVQTFEDGVADLNALNGRGILKAEHFLHLRCELPAPEMPGLLDRVIDDPLVRLISLMDHSPGMGQYADVDRYRRMREADGFAEHEITEIVTGLQANHAAYHQTNRDIVLELVHHRDIPIASHDDRTAEEVIRNHKEGITISEFPVALAAARTAHAHAVKIIAGAPNIVRGGSHSGNVAVLDLVREGLLDALASDYVPAAMMEAVFACVQQNELTIPQALALVTAGPADLVNLADRGRIATGLRADFVQVHLHEGIPVIRAVWRVGHRVA